MCRACLCGGSTHKGAGGLRGPLHAAKERGAAGAERTSCPGVSRKVMCLAPPSAGTSTV